ncbi:MAG: type II toxin-antitoxin system VapC family toxin [Leptolyngbyaceae bacterium]|nr:type II toxin-antitoxin system VapC family toxin [Leptolyngbyaceae bacterium]
MNLLLDTHIFLWLITGNPRLDETVKTTIEQPENAVFLSVASVWECVIKQQLGKLPLPDDAAIYLSQQRENHFIDSLNIDEVSVSQLSQLPMLHRDPFDRILMGQALRYGLTLVTVDAAIKQYAVPVLSW